MALPMLGGGHAKMGKTFRKDGKVCAARGLGYEEKYGSGPAASRPHFPKADNGQKGDGKRSGR